MRFLGKGLALILLMWQAAVVQADQRGVDYPHSSATGTGCNSCHYYITASPSWLDYVPENSDDTYCNKWCWSCHNNTIAPRMDTHSSNTTSTKYGSWSVECRVCHWPHHQQQLRAYKPDSYVDSGVSSEVTTTTLKKNNAGWIVDAYKDMILIPDTSTTGNRYSYQYKITGNTSDTITVKSSIDVLVRVANKNFAVIHGKLIKSTITTPNSGNKTVRFFRPTGINSFADGGATRDGVCEVCHTKTTHYRNDGTGSQQSHENLGGKNGTDCLHCHSHANGFKHGGVGGGGDGSGCSGAANCHQAQKAHPAHVGGMLSGVNCLTCHQQDNFPLFADGQNLTNTTVCNSCHSANGVALAKQYFAHPGSTTNTAGSWAVVEGQKSYCGSCHDSTPGNTKKDGSGDSAKNTLGNDTNYGFYVTGHGKASGNYQKLSWQDTTATGNSSANRSCNACHDLASAHFNTADKRLKAGYENNQANANCNQCHPPGTAAVANPQFYTSSTDYENSAHGGKLCIDCHDVHGAVGNYPGMTIKSKKALCENCHSNGGHPGVGTKSFAVSGKSYTLECVSCHNVHVVTGTYAQAAQNKSPITKLTDITNVWGDVAGEKMNAYAGSGTYRTPKDESFSGAQLPDYPTFCLTCHGTAGSGSVYFGINWDSDNHGRASANQPNGYGTCPNWFACGNAFGWDGDDCAGTQSECWPVIPRGAGDQLYSREVYTHTDRIAGANFTLSCTDCHTGHGTGTLGRPNVNGGAFTSNWNNMCNRCHYYYSDWHAGMSCGNASCHVSARMNNTGAATLHAMSHQTGSGATRPAHESGLVFKYSFENNLNDSSGFQMDGKWYSASGTFATGKSGQAVVLAQGKTVQVGTENGYWSTDEGYHGTWKYTEMKYNTTLEAWVNPTDNAKSEYTIFNKHVGVSSNGGYSFALKKIGGMLRATFNMAVDNNGFTQDGRAGIRGAYSSVAVPLNKWTNVAVTFDTSGADRNPSDPSAGRIRIYVNGEDVTTSDASGNNMQPGTGETSIYAYSENSPWNQGICYNGTWCASEFSIGGFDWESTNFIGMIDEAKVWNSTKNAAYFASLDSQTAPYISSVTGLIGSNQLTVTFAEGVYTNTGSVGALVSADFVLTDTGADNARTITGVTHTAGSASAVITMSKPLAVSDVNADVLAAATNAIYDNYNNAAGTETVIIGLSSQCPTSQVIIQLNETSGSSYIMDSQSILYGAVYGGASTLTGSAYSGGGDSSGRYIQFDYNSSCLATASTAMTIETRLKPTGIPNDTSTNYVRRIMARDGSGNFQLSVWRNETWGNYRAPAGEASIALWVYPVTPGTTWKPVLTNYTGAKTGSENDCPIVSDHWYQVKTVWNTNKPGGTPGQYFTPAEIWVEDQGTDGLGAAKKWAGSLNCTDADQSLKSDNNLKFSTGDVMKTATGENFTIGTNRSTTTSNLFNGLIDWIFWKDTVD